MILTVHRQLDATEVFIADLIACSTCFGHHYAHHLELKSIIQWLLPVAFRAVVFRLLVWCGAEGYVSGLQEAVAEGYVSGLQDGGKVVSFTHPANRTHNPQLQHPANRTYNPQLHTRPAT